MTPRFADVAETHSGIVFFVGDRAYKVKKRVNLGFLDYTERETRQRICHREIELNKRLAPDVYLGVADLVGPDREVEDHLVVMRRLPEDRSLSELVAIDDPGVADQLVHIARQLASFHSAASTSPEIDRAAGADAELARWQANQTDISDLGTEALGVHEVSEVVELARRYVAGRGALFRSRIAAGKARDGHGDLLADDIFCLDDGPRILDCIEFDDHLRYGDVLSDIAFLAMDLERLGRTDLARQFVDAYRRYSADSWPPSLEHHYIAYRAFVRAKVAAFRAHQLGSEKAGDATQLLMTARAHLERARVRLILIGGLPASGKSTLAATVADGLDAVMISSDELRKQHAGLDVATPAAAGYQQGLYRPELTRRIYDLIFEQAMVSLADGFNVVIDATFHDGATREEARTLAESAWADMDQIECVAPTRVIEERILKRSSEGPGPSDASLGVARAMQADRVPWPSAHQLDTSGPIETIRKELLERLHIQL